MAYDFPGVALVTGAASGIGRATAVLYAKEGCNRISISDVNGKGLEETKSLMLDASPGVEVRTTICDNTNEQSVQAFIDGTIEQFGRLDYAANVAGITVLGPGTADITTEFWDRDHHVNLRGLFFCERAELRAMLRQETLVSRDSKYAARGAIVNVASMAGLNGMKDIPAYTASKHGVVGLSKADGLRYGQFGIRVNTLCPGATATPILANSGNDPSQAPLVDSSNAGNALNRFGDPEELAQCLVWLTSARASYVTASVLAANGGEIGV